MNCPKPHRKTKVSKKETDVCKNETKIFNSNQTSIIIVNRKMKKKVRCRPRRLLKWYDFIEVPNPMIPGGPAITTFPLPTPPDSFGSELPIDGLFITLSRIDRNDREELKATIVWNFGVTTINPGPEITIFSQKMQFSIWRDAPLTGTRLCTVVDSGHITELSETAPAGTLMTNTVTTSFACTDTKIFGKTHRYFLTGAAGVANGFFVAAGDGDDGPTPITTFINPTVTEVHFSGSVIDRN
ncbi:hypothetical protein [Bacillus sp. FJAT-28004]|uniref:hypothetical protein n=1 Tax=Bacillus sp. FJAT-28004 TaxID=1679165 RepID=UPI0006B5E7AF|nr:hypothetical protein [Bacillus sp. FJAT-28004]